MYSYIGLGLFIRTIDTVLRTDITLQLPLVSKLPGSPGYLLGRLQHIMPKFVHRL